MASSRRTSPIDSKRPLLIAAAALLTTTCDSDETSTKIAGDRNDAAELNAAEQTAVRYVRQGRDIFYNDTFGSEAFWGGALALHDALKGEALGGVGPGVSPTTALGVGLKVDSEALSTELADALAAGQVDLDDPASTVALLREDAVIGVRGVFAGDELAGVGITCAFCHATVDDALAPGIGRPLDGWANRDLDVGAIVSLAPNLQVIADRLGVTTEDLRAVLATWGPGKYDAEVLLDGKALRPDGSAAATLIPPAFGLAGVNLHTWTGFGSVPYWNAYVANTQMRGQGTFYDPRLADAAQYPIAAATGDFDLRAQPDLISSKLPALHVFQLALAAPAAPADSFDAAAADRGEALFAGKAQCARCHVPPLFLEPGHSIHRPEEIGIDDFQSERSPEHGYRTAPLRGLWTHTKGGFYHDGRFATLADVIDHYDSHFTLGLSAGEKSDLAQFLLSLGGPIDP